MCKETMMSKWIWISNSMPKWIALTLFAGVVGLMMTLGCSQQRSSPAAEVQAKAYMVPPESVTVKAGIITNEVTETQ
jgi:hypothetical protein